MTSDCIVSFLFMPSPDLQQQHRRSVPLGRRCSGVSCLNSTPLVVAPPSNVEWEKYVDANSLSLTSLTATTIFEYYSDGIATVVKGMQKYQLESYDAEITHVADDFEHSLLYVKGSSPRSFGKPKMTDIILCFKYDKNRAVTAIRASICGPGCPLRYHKFCSHRACLAFVVSTFTSTCTEMSCAWTTNKKALTKQLKSSVAIPVSQVALTFRARVWK